MTERPVPDAVTAGPPATGEIGALAGCVGGLRRGSEGLVGIDDEGGEELVPARKVPVDT